MCEAHLLGGSGGMPPQEYFCILDHLGLFLVQFWDEIARFRQSAAVHA